MQCSKKSIVHYHITLEYGFTMSNKKPSTQQKSLNEQSVELSAAVPEVIAHRMNSFMSAGLRPSEGHQEEFQLMWSEKSDAFVDSWKAMAHQASIVNKEFYSSIMQTMFTPWWNMQAVEVYTHKQFNKAALSVLNKGLEPIHKTTTSNAKRLKSGS